MHKSDTVLDVAIAGASYAGLALALALSRSLGPELRLAVVEPRPIGTGTGSTEGDPRVFALAAGSRRLLEAVDAWWRIAPEAEPVVAIDITDSSLDDAFRPVLLSYDNRLAGEPQTHIAPAAAIGRALAAAVRAEPSIRLIEGARVRALEPATGHTALVLDDGRHVRAHLVVGADGGSSPTRAAAGIGVTELAHGQSGIAAIVAHEHPHEGRAVQHFLPAGPFALLPMTGRRSAVTWSEETRRAEQIMALDDTAFLAELQHRAGRRLGIMTLLGSRAAFPLTSRLARELIRPRLALVGDAARSVHPIAGQGVNLALRDVAALTQSIADAMRLGLGPGDVTVLERYRRWRRFDSVQSGATFVGLNALFSTDNLAIRGLRDAGLGLVDRLPGLKQLLVAEAAGGMGEVPRLLEGVLP